MIIHTKAKSIIFICVSFFLFMCICLMVKDDKFATNKGIVINEVCYNFSVSYEKDGANYVELYNPTEETIYLDDYCLANNANAINAMEIEPIEIPAKSFQNIYIDDNWEEMDFSLSENVSGAEVFSLFLFDSQGLVVDTVDVPQIKYDTSWARVSDGSDEWDNMLPTPAQSNYGAQTVMRETLTAPLYSAESGFYEKEFLLELSTQEDDCNIFYTLDGSIPDENSILYENPIRIYNNSDSPNLYASLEDFSTGYNQDGYDMGKVTSESVPKCMVVRSIVYSKDGTQKGDVATKTYFVGDEGKYDNFAVVSLIGDPENFWDYEKGIYVTGATFDSYISSVDLSETEWMFWNANYRNKGKAWEREVHLDYFSASHELVMEQEVGVRTKGGATRSYPQKSFNVYARNIYEQNTFKKAFFEGNKGLRRITLFAGANDIDTKIRDVLVHNLCSDLEFGTMESIPCYVFLNGEYWGFYYITEKFDESYIQENYGVSEEDVVMIKAGFAESGITAAEDYAELLNFVETTDLSSDAGYSRIQEYIDMQSFMEYYATQLYIARCNDWPSGNWATWKSDEVRENVPYYDGKWRWILFDLNWANGGMSEWLLEYDVVQYVREQDVLFDRLMDNAQFRSEFAYVFCNIANTNFEDDRVVAEIDRLSAIVEGPVKQDYKRFYQGTLTEESFQNGVNDIRIFFENRKGYIMDKVLDHCELQGTCEDVWVNMSDKDAGEILVNGISLDLADEEWYGMYYTDFPISIEVVVNPGYEFVGWNGDLETKENGVTFTIPEGGISLQADFVKKYSFER